MGCSNSKDEEAFQSVDDSVHTGIKLAKKKQEQRGEVPAYRPRVAHPMLEQKRSEKESEQDAAPTSTGSLEDSGQA
eukprot:CAMPEP_0113625726 /NCGR_PEP_ID=MMETSP0017_2-20120614/13291_1 /TAXON_ID=2856 /ORGANISM="Cylindrotheca closterium" /LENGTH=75 /DNA_ID=CAMNT_0000535855 /DNA_START=226 /DNA_END=453 /DNA_ORIENTATION=+ /assembly_acc=CAM_ASM_000147